MLCCAMLCHAVLEQVCHTRICTNTLSQTQSMSQISDPASGITLQMQKGSAQGFFIFVLQARIDLILAERLACIQSHCLQNC